MTQPYRTKTAEGSAFLDDPGEEREGRGRLDWLEENIDVGDGMYGPRYRTIPTTRVLIEIARAIIEEGDRK